MQRHHCTVPDSDGSQSKGGRGAHGFGSAGQEAQDAEKDPNSAEVPVEGVDGEEGDPAASSEPIVEAEPEIPSLTMEEFLAQRAGTMVVSYTHPF